MTERVMQPPIAFDVSPVDQPPGLPNPTVGMTLGFLAGIAGTWVMERFAAARRDGPLESAASPSWDGNGESPAGDDDAVARAATDLARGVIGREIDHDVKPLLATAARYLFGGFVGAVYGAAAEHDPGLTRGFGASFGVAAWSLADALAPPEALQDFDQDDDAAEHVADAGPALARMLPRVAYGVTTEVVRRGLRSRFA